MVLILLFTLAHQDQYRLIADRFNLSESTVHVIVQELCEILRYHLLYEYIVWPSPQQQTEISDYYESVRGINGCIGSIDATHIQIETPKEFEGDYYNRKLVHSVVLQAVCDCELQFTHIDAGAYMY